MCIISQVPARTKPSLYQHSHDREFLEHLGSVRRLGQIFRQVSTGIVNDLMLAVLPQEAAPIQVV